MRMTRFIDPQGNLRAGVDRGDGTADVFEQPSVLGAPRPTGRLEKIATRLAPLAPANIFCIGLNYRDHAEETGAALPEQPVIFMKPTSTLHHPEQAIRIPACCNRGDEVDYECELAVIIGREGRDIPESAALDHVLGYTVANDVSARRWQKHGGGGQWIRGKSFDTFCPLGPVLVTADELTDPQNLALTTTIAGETLQDGRSAQMIFTVAQIIAFLSQDTTLLPGTVILTGTPAGVGVGRTPPRFLQPGEEVIVSITGIGELRNPVERA
jgi:2-keto-4-pentenoate hydratase/2-oxohepta-3-ene-1,7-dioic acid hydratase in catechol pathway